MSLTEDWKVNKLCYGKSYWCRGEDGQVEICKLGCDNKFYSGDFEIEGIEKVLAICDYEELQRLKEENKRMAYDLGNQGYKIKNQRHEINNRISEINKLRALLKEDNADLQVGADSLRELNKIMRRNYDKKVESLIKLLRECLAHLSLGEIGTSVTPINDLLTHITAAIGESEEV